MDEPVPFLDHPRDYWAIMRATTPSGSFSERIRCRTKPLRCFRISASVDRIIFGVISQLNKAWMVKPPHQFTFNS